MRRGRGRGVGRGGRGVGRAVGRTGATTGGEVETEVVQSGETNENNDGSVTAIIVTGKVPPLPYPDILWNENRPFRPIPELSSDKADFLAKEAMRIQRKLHESPFYVTLPPPKPEIQKYENYEEVKRIPTQLIQMKKDVFSNELITLKVSRAKRKFSAIKQIEDDENEDEEEEEEGEEDEDEIYTRLQGEEVSTDSDDEWKARDDDDIGGFDFDDGGGDEEPFIS